MKRLCAALLLGAALFMNVSARALDEGLNPDKIRVQEAPMPLLSFQIKEGQTIDLTKAAELHVIVNHCEYGEPMQIIRAESIVKQAANAMRAITVEGLYDRIDSTATYYSYDFYDADGAYLGSASFQDGLLMTPDGRYNVSGLSALLGIEGIMLDDDWDKYWRASDEAEQNYLNDLKIVYPASIFEVRGYAASRLKAEDVTGVEISVSRNDEAGKLQTNDQAMIARVYKALQSVKAINQAPEDGDGLTYYVTLSYIDPDVNIDRSVWFRFEGERLACDHATYAVSGLNNLFAIEGVDVLTYLRGHYMD